MNITIKQGANTADIAHQGVLAVHARKIARYAAQSTSTSFQLNLDHETYNVNVIRRSAKKVTKATVKGTRTPAQIMKALDSGRQAYRDLSTAEQAIARSQRSKRAAKTAAEARAWN